MAMNPLDRFIENLRSRMAGRFNFSYSGHNHTSEAKSAPNMDLECETKCDTRTTLPEHPASSPTTDSERLAALEEEEALFRLYWRTLPNKTLARRTWPSQVRWYCEQKGLGQEMMDALNWRCRDLLGKET
jgi:hypothetical protein